MISAERYIDWGGGAVVSEKLLNETKKTGRFFFGSR